MEFRLARSARDRYGFTGVAASASGDEVIVDEAGSRALASAMAPTDPARRERIAIDVAAIGLIHELGHRAIAGERRRAKADGGPLALALAASSARLGADVVEAGLAAFENEFPSAAVYRGDLDVRAWLARGSVVPAAEAALEELMLTWVALQNPAVAPYRDLLDDAPLATTPVPLLVRTLGGSAVRPDGAGPDPEAPARPLLDRLLEPARAAPQSLGAQLRWMRIHWAGWLEAADLNRIDERVHDLEVAERETFLLHRKGASDASGPRGTTTVALDLGEPEAFSEDRDWMAELVLIAKSTYVWLAQLSSRFAREITRLDQVPDEVLDELHASGFTGLWLIGIWERSAASREIKRRRGNPDAMASAYSVADYVIAGELGGEDAWRDLRDRAAARGLRLAADMVPNHMGIDSRWVMDHPERFVTSPHPPFEAYRYDGPDLSSDGRVVLQIEDHYWDSTDAAVTFRRLDRESGETRFIYHGNDGTSFPWNDTAQLDYLRPDVREAVIGQILDVARRFPVIRFDAAMVLAKRHIQRLWYPLPGQEAGIPSRGAAALPAAEFERRMPAEFWREVVDRVAVEAPDTLLLAEAFWLLEGYFVRTLGMHRVYNSAFMHMLRDERNAEYQAVIRDTVAFDARILGRYVNFMSNPDERSAIDQFGSHDKYFGVATLLATLPGLPMFGHGQVEGYTEQYGMEFRRPMRDEVPDEGLMARHRREIFPLLRERWRFAGADAFRQLVAREGGADVPDVLAYANDASAAPSGAPEGRSLVVYLNRYPRAHVRVDGVAEALRLDGEEGAFVLLRDQRTGLDYLRECRDLRERGLELVLDGYACHVFLGFEVVSGPGWRELAWRIGLRGVAAAHAARQRLVDEPMREAVAAIFDDPLVIAAISPGWADVAQRPLGEPVAGDGWAEAFARLRVATGSHAPTDQRVTDVGATLARAAGGRRGTVSAAVAGWLAADAIASASPGDDPATRVERFDAWDIGAVLGERMRRVGYPDAITWRAVELVRAMLVVAPGAIIDASDIVIDAWLASPPVRAATGWNAWQDRQFVRREAWAELLEAVAARDRLLAIASDDDVLAAVRAIERRIAAAGFEVPLVAPSPAAGAPEPPPEGT